jgi:hypothetical protein
MLDGKPSNFTEDDIGRRNTITTLLSDWGLLTIVDELQAETKTSLRQIKIISHRDKNEWNLESKYSIGNVKKA